MSDLLKTRCEVFFLSVWALVCPVSHVIVPWLYGYDCQRPERNPLPPNSQRESLAASFMSVQDINISLKQKVCRIMVCTPDVRRVSSVFIVWCAQAKHASFYCLVCALLTCWYNPEWHHKGIMSYNSFFAPLKLPFPCFYFMQTNSNNKKNVSQIFIK